MLVLLLLLTWPLQAVSDTPTSPKDTLKAAISYNLARFVSRITEDDASTIGPLIFCVLKNSPIVSELRFMNSGKDRKLAFELRELSEPSAFYEGCDISFVSDRLMPEVSLENLAAAGSVTIGAIDGFLDAGGAIELVQTGQKFGFSVNLAALRLAEKSLSSRVLKLALKVRPAS